MKFRQRLRNIFKTPAAGKGDEPHAVGELHDMAVRIDKRRQQRAALKIHDPGIRTGEGTHVGKAADAADDAVFFHKRLVYGGRNHRNDRTAAVQGFSHVIHTILSLAGNGGTAPLRYAVFFAETCCAVILLYTETPGSYTGFCEQKESPRDFSHGD